MATEVCHSHHHWEKHGFVGDALSQTELVSILEMDHDDDTIINEIANNLGDITGLTTESSLMFDSPLPARLAALAWRRTHRSSFSAAMD